MALNLPDQFGLAAASMLLCGAIYALAAPTLVAPFSDDPAVSDIAEAMVLVMGSLLVSDGIQPVLIFSLRAARDQVAAGFIQATSFFCVMTAAA